MFNGTPRVAQQITIDELVAATSTSVRRAVKENENKPSGISAPIIVGYLVD